MDPLGRLHLITDRWELALAALAAGSPDQLVVQVRAGEAVTDREAYQLAGRIRAVCAEHGVTCLINDRVDLALAVGADGVHLGADDLPIAVARDLLGPAAIVGASCRYPQAAPDLVAAGADYLGAGPAYPTTTKAGLPEAIGPAGVAAVAAAVPGTPVLGIGGVTAPRAAELLAAGAYGVAVIGAIGAAADPTAATRELLRAVAVTG